MEIRDQREIIIYWAIHQLERREGDQVEMVIFH